jgi:pimeloyl-ACP methyl ester carboxylesterase
MAAGQGAADPGSARPRAQVDFRAYSSNGQIPNARFYYIESTAPDSVEQRVDPGGEPPDGLTSVDPDEAVKEIVETLTPENDPGVGANLVVMVHGFNTPRDQALDFYGKALEALKKDKDKLFGDAARRTVCVGYRWPSERIGSVLLSSLSALPAFPLILLVASFLALAICIWLIAAILKVVGVAETNLTHNLFTRIAVLCGLVIFAIVVLALLRAIVYFRDVYRATNYGVPDLVEVIRQIDREAVQRMSDLGERNGLSPRPRIALSFVGHSMGGLIVTNAIRVLSDVFGKDVIRTYLSGRLRPEMAAREREGEEDEVPGRIGHVFALMRFVLISPDIPAEALLADRANFLASSLRRFREAYLFSNEGDEVLRAISTAVNYFTFPTLSRVYGYRLGNTEILASAFGATPSGPNQLDLLRAGTETLKSLSGQTTRAQRPAAVTRAFTFFDCTDYKDGEPPRGMLTQALNFKKSDPTASIPLSEQLRLLTLYVLGRVDVHGGYFDGPVAQRLIYRLACLGFDKSLGEYGDEDAMLAECADHQIRVMLSDRLRTRTPRPAEPMDLSDYS